MVITDGISKGRCYGLELPPCQVIQPQLLCVDVIYPEAVLGSQPHGFGDQGLLYVVKVDARGLIELVIEQYHGVELAVKQYYLQRVLEVNTAYFAQRNIPVPEAPAVFFLAELIIGNGIPPPEGIGAHVLRWACFGVRQYFYGNNDLLRRKAGIAKKQGKEQQVFHITKVQKFMLAKNNKVPDAKVPIIQLCHLCNA